MPRGFATGFLFVDREQSYIENSLYIHGRRKPPPALR